MLPDAKRLARVVKARSDMLADQPFFGFLALRLKLVEDPGCAGMWCDSVTLGFNPQYIDSLVDIELQGLIAKTVMHIVAEHNWRQDSRETVTWNEACAEAINPMVVEANFRLPSGMVTTSEHGGTSAEFIYNKLMEERKEEAPEPPPPAPAGGGGDSEGTEPQAEDSDPPGPSKHGTDDSEQAPGQGSGDQEGEGQGEGEGTGEGGGNGSRPAPVPPHMLCEVRQAPTGAEEGDEGEKLQAQWQMAVESATHMQGDLPGNLVSMVEGTLKSRVDWKSVLQNFIESSMQSPDYTMSTPNRRYLHLGFILPGLRGGNLRTLYVARDTSGSINKFYRQLFNGELLDIIERMKPERVVVVDCDTHIQKVQDMLGDEADQDLDHNTYGGGGTDFRPVFAYAEEEDLEPSCLVFLTDLLGRFPEKAPDYPVLWAVPEGSNRGTMPPFGEFIELEMD